MARYDRIARIDPPARDTAFGGWLTLRDLDGREREPELGRRARLRYLALRPARRLLRQGLEELDSDSLHDQIDAIREELGRLPSDDPERERLEKYLVEIGGRSPAGLVRATLDVGAAAEAAGHAYAAEEFYRTADELSRERDLPALTVVALRMLGRVQRARHEWDDATSSLRESALHAIALDDLVEWARSMEGLAAVQLRRGAVDEARATLAEIENRPVEDGDRDRVRAIAAVGRCALELSEQRPDAAVEAGWDAIRALAPDDEARNGVLLNMGAALRRLGLHDAAASCYRIVRRWAAWPEHRIEAELELAAVAAEAGDRDSFERHRERVMESMRATDRPLQALACLGLGRSAALLGDYDVGRDHLREAIATARDLDDQDILTRSEGLFEALEARSPPTPEPPQSELTTQVRRIADGIGRLDADLVPAG